MPSASSLRASSPAEQGHGPAGAAAFAGFAARGANSWWRYLVCAVLAFALWIAFLVVVAFAIARLNLGPSNLAAELTSPSDPIPFFLSTGVLFASLTAAFAVASRWLLRKSFMDLVGAWRWRRFLSGAAIWSVLIVVSTLADVLLQPKGFSVTAGAGTAALAGAALVGLGAQTFAEEWIFRGWLTQGLYLAVGRRAWPAAVLSGLIFGAAHIPNGWPQAASAACFGVAAAWLAIRTGGIAFTLGLHLVNNLFGAVVVVSASDVFKGSPGLFTQNTSGLMWWDVAVEIASLALVVGLVMRSRRLGFAD